MRKTYNGAPTIKHSGNACLDLFALIGSARNHPAGVVQAFARAYASDSALALRILLWARDVRQGAGERETFRNLLHWLERAHPDVAAAVVRSGVVQALGRWDDLLGLQSAHVWPEVLAQVRAALARGDKLAAKWMPRQGRVAAKLRADLGLDAKSWRQLLSAGSHTVEQLMCAGAWSSIRFDHVPSVAAARLHHAFRAHESERYSAYLEAVKEGRQTMHAGTVFPHDVVRAAVVDDEAATVQWTQLPKPKLAGNALLVCDVSASMTVQVSGNTSALDVCVALGLLLSESLPEPFANQVLTFTESPSWHRIKGQTLAERATSLRGARWGGNTDFRAAFELILSKAKEARAQGVEFQLPETLLVLSDMEFDRAGVRGKTNLQVMQSRFADAGFPCPRLVFWNLNARVGNLPAGSQPGVALISGFSPRIAELVLSGRLAEYHPEILMREAVCVPRYAIPGLTTDLA